MLRTCSYLHWYKCVIFSTVFPRLVVSVQYSLSYHNPASAVAMILRILGLHCNLMGLLGFCFTITDERFLIFCFFITMGKVGLTGSVVYNCWGVFFSRLMESDNEAFLFHASWFISCMFSVLPCLAARLKVFWGLHYAICEGFCIVRGL